MTWSIDNNYSSYLNKYNSGIKLAEAFWNTTESNDSETENAWSIVARQCDAKVDLCLEKVGKQVVLDLAQDTASYLSEHPDLANDYVLVIIEDPTLGREARAYRRSELVAGLEEPRKTEVTEALEENTLIYFESAEGLPATPEDSAVQGLAEVAQDFLNKNEKLLNILSRKDLQPWLT
jgi:hypothetical protein